MGYSIVWNRFVNFLHPWENLILNHFEGLKSKATQPADGPSIFDVSDQFDRIRFSLIETPVFEVWARISLATIMRKLIRSSYRRLQKLYRKTRLLFQGFRSRYITGETLAEAYARTLLTNRLAGYRVLTDNDYKLFWSKVSNPLNDDPAASSTAQLHISLATSMMTKICARTLVLTQKGYLGLGPTKAQKGDLVCVLYGCSVPVILRKEGQGHRFIGESYVHGLMDRAAVDQQSLRDTLEEREFILR